jgi:hypothetical protein
MSLERRVPLKKKRDTPRRVPTFTCSMRGCTKPPKAHGLCGRHLIKRCDELFAKVIKLRDRFCQACGRADWPECAHIESRRYFAVRWSEDNAVQLDRDCHMRYTMDPIAWADWCIERMGREAWEANRAKARRGGMPDTGWLLGELTERLKDLEAAA